jgi:hypothetical protein
MTVTKFIFLIMLFTIYSENKIPLPLPQATASIHSNLFNFLLTLSQVWELSNKMQLEY